MDPCLPQTFLGKNKREDRHCYRTELEFSLVDFVNGVIIGMMIIEIPVSNHPQTC